MDDISEDLRRVPLFADLDRRQLKRLAGRLRERTLPPGTTPLEEGTMSGIGFFVIAAGEATVSVAGKTVATLGPGDHFGELALVSQGKRTATVTANDDLRVYEIPFYDFHEFAMANPDVTWKLLQHVVALLYPETQDSPSD
ncbi:MAG: cyclic nucleotide-binding domain-containing protein [Gaiellaceae bacterium]|jgi:CRP-like cAMP-binding protein